ncbi:MAG: hypothetical protein RLZZ420_1737 [Bacteroidota bacterium]|jgi:hypothetical protein
MTQIAIKQQIADIQKATENATKSQAAALKFLKEAGILQNLSIPKSVASSASVVRKKK